MLIVYKNEDDMMQRYYYAIEKKIKKTEGFFLLLSLCNCTCTCICSDIVAQSNETVLWKLLVQSSNKQYFVN